MLLKHFSSAILGERISVVNNWNPRSPLCMVSSRKMFNCIVSTSKWNGVLHSRESGEPTVYPLFIFHLIKEMNIRWFLLSLNLEMTQKTLNSKLCDVRYLSISISYYIISYFVVKDNLTLYPGPFLYYIVLLWRIFKE